MVVAVLVGMRKRSHVAVERADDGVYGVVVVISRKFLLAIAGLHGIVSLLHFVFSDLLTTSQIHHTLSLLKTSTREFEVRFGEVLGGYGAVGLARGGWEEAELGRCWQVCFTKSIFFPGTFVLKSEYFRLFPLLFLLTFR